jgi:integrase
VKEQMGHNSINVTVDIYGHLVPGGNRQAVDKLDAVVAERAETAENAAAR